MYEYKQGGNSMKCESRKILIDIIVVYVIALLAPTIHGFYTYVSGNIQYNSLHSNYQFILAILERLGGILILWYVMYKNDSNLQGFGLSFRFKDIWHSIVLILLYYLGNYFVSILIYYIAPSFYSIQPKNIEFFMSKITIWYVLLMIINPFFEELIVRSFFIEKIEALTNSSLVAIILSIILQLLPHIYQGFIALIYLGVMFTIFSLYYVRYRRIVPVILAHMFFDIIAMINYGG